MNQLFLISSLQPVAPHIASKINVSSSSKIALIGTAMEVISGGDDFISSDHQTFTDLGFNVNNFTITGKTASQIQSDLKYFDIIYFSGGNYLYLLHQIQVSNSAKVIVDLVNNQKKIFIGTSSGAMIAGPNLQCAYNPEVETEAGVKLTDFTGLGLVNFTVFPHWGSPEYKSKYFNSQLNNAFSTTSKIILLTNNQYIHIRKDMSKIIDVSKIK